jgi:tetratricopeptide (TPR) repeat protein
MVLAEELVQQARNKNFDNCEGNLFAAKFDIAKGDSQSALSRLNDCLKARPVFANGYLLRSQVNGGIGNYEEAISDVKMAQRFNPLDKAIAKQVAAVLYNRSLRLGTNASSEQIAETEQALGGAIFLNPDDWNLRSIYAEYISEREPATALAVRQRLVKRFPNVDNNLMLGNMAMRMAAKETDEERRTGLLDIARSGYEKAYKMAPTVKRVLNGYAEYLRLTGKGDKATEVLEGLENELWRYFIRDGQYDKAADILRKLYKEEPENVTVVRVLAIIAGKTDDKEELKKYSMELVELENTAENLLMQIQAYLEAGLVKEAKLKLDSFRERYPDEPKGILLEAWSSMTKGQLKQALEYVNQSLEITPENAVAWRLRGQINRLLGEFERAVEDLQKSKSIDTNPKIRMELATVYRRIGRVTVAIGELTAALKNQQAPPRVRTMLEQLYLQAGRKTDLKQFYDETLQKYPDSGLWHLRAGQFALQEKQYEQAEQLLKRSWEISEERGGYIPALDKYLEALWRGQKYEELLKYAAKYIDTKSAPIAYAQMAQARFKMGSKATAMDYYRKAIEKCGTDDGLIIGILQNMSNIIGPMEVVKWCNEKLQASPDSLAANLMMFNLSQQRGEYNKALGHIDKFLSLVDPDSPVWIEQMLRKANTLTMMYMKTSNKQYLSIAVSEFEKILAKQPNNTSVLNNLAYFLADNNEQLDKALEYAKRAHEASPNDGNIMDTYAYTLCKVGDYAKAEEVLQMAIQIFERESAAVAWDIYKHLGMAQEGLGQKAAACESYRQTLQVGGRRISKQNREELTKAIERVCG